ncbi:MAG: ribonuclease P protein component [Coriobacteriia bacterium]|nr:ribonuclease P protein component [Coriobacteriia bacterium]
MTRFTTLSSKGITATLQSGRRHRSRSLLAFVDALSNESSEGPDSLLAKIAFIAPKRLGNAVLRNRCKRLLRAGMTLALENARVRVICDNNNIILMANPKTVEADSSQIAEEIISILEK